MLLKILLQGPVLNRLRASCTAEDGPVNFASAVTSHTTLPYSSSRSDMLSVLMLGCHAVLLLHPQTAYSHLAAWDCCKAAVLLLFGVCVPACWHPHPHPTPPRPGPRAPDAFHARQPNPL
jgi:hypothetical protein